MIAIPKPDGKEDPWTAFTLQARNIEEKFRLGFISESEAAKDLRRYLRESVDLDSGAGHE